MPATLSTLKLVDDKTKYLIYGYLREIEIKLSNITTMPIDIKNLCIIYYYYDPSKIWKPWIKEMTKIGFDKAVIINRVNYATIASTNYQTDIALAWKDKNVYVKWLIY